MRSVHQRVWSMSGGKRSADSEDRNVTVSTPLMFVLPEQPRPFGKWVQRMAFRAIVMPRIALWQVVRMSVAMTYFWIGGTYFFGNPSLKQVHNLHLLVNLEPGGLRAHGLILFVLAFSIASRPAFSRQIVVGLSVTLFYSVLTAALIVGGWSFHAPDYAAPAWYLLVAVLSFALIFSQPATTAVARKVR